MMKLIRNGVDALTGGDTELINDETVIVHVVVTRPPPVPPNTMPPDTSALAGWVTTVAEVGTTFAPFTNSRAVVMSYAELGSSQQTVIVTF